MYQIAFVLRWCVLQLPELDDLDEDVVEELVSQYHFGGGDGEGGEAGMGRGPDGKPKTRKEVRGTRQQASIWHVASQTRQVRQVSKQLGAHSASQQASV